MFVLILLSFIIIFFSVDILYGDVPVSTGIAVLKVAGQELTCKTGKKN